MTPHQILRFSPTLVVAFENTPTSVHQYLKAEFGGVWQEGYTDQPVIRIRFSTLRLPASRQYIGARAVTAGDKFYLRDPNGALISINFSDFDRDPPLVIESESSISPRYFLQCLEHCLRVVALKKDHVFVHASGFSIDNRVILIPAWAHTGKTNTLLSFLLGGAKYYGDDWCLLSAGQLIAYPKRINLFGYNFSQFPELRSRLPIKTRAFFNLISCFSAVLRPFTHGRGAFSHYAKTFADLFENQGHVRTNLTDLFPNVSLAGPGKITEVFIPQRTTDPISVTPLTPTELIKRLTPCLEHERASFFEWYRMYLFAFPHRHSAYVDQLANQEARLLEKQLTGVKINYLSLNNGSDTNAIVRTIRSRWS